MNMLVVVSDYSPCVVWCHHENAVSFLLNNVLHVFFFFLYVPDMIKLYITGSLVWNYFSFLFTPVHKVFPSCQVWRITCFCVKKKLTTIPNAKELKNVAHVLFNGICSSSCYSNFVWPAGFTLDISNNVIWFKNFWR